MSLQLDARQRAMLEEMGIKLFWPDAPVEDKAVLPAPPQPAVPLARTPGPPGEADLALVLQQWDPHKAGGAAAPGDAELQADWLVLADGASESNELGESLAAQSAKLLDNMLLAMGLTRRDRVAVGHLMPARGSEADAVAAFEPAVRRQVERLRPKLLLVMGRACAQALLQTSEPLGRLRGRAHEYAGIPAIVSYAPVYLLRNGADKAKAWADLCLARAVIRERG
jgi:DNA polymerase